MLKFYKVVAGSILLHGSQPSGLLNRYGDGLRAGRSEFDSRQGQEIFLLLHSVQTGSGAHLVSYSMCTGDYFPGGKAARA
jgi:hypothetical protein